MEEVKSEEEEDVKGKGKGKSAKKGKVAPKEEKEATKKETEIKAEGSAQRYDKGKGKEEKEATKKKRHGKDKAEEEDEEEEKPTKKRKGREEEGEEKPKKKAKAVPVGKLCRFANVEPSKTGGARFVPVGGTRRERTFAGAGHAHRIEKFTNKLGDLIGIKPAQVKQHYRVCLDTGSRSDKGHRRSLLSACLITAREAEADVLDRACGVRGEYRFGRKKASEIVESEEDCPRSGAFMYAGVRVGNAGNVGEQICYRVHLAGTRVPDANNVGNKYVTGYISRVHVYPTLRTSGNKLVTGYNTWVHICYRVHLAGTLVPGAENVGQQFC